VPTPAEHIQTYIAMRDECTAIRREADTKIADIKRRMELIEDGFAEKVLVDGMNSFSTDSGRAHAEIRRRFMVRDKGSFTDFILANPADRISLLELRPLQKNCKQYTDDFDDCPDGLFVESQRKIIISRKN